MKNVRSKSCKYCNYSDKVNAEEMCVSCAGKVSEMCGVCGREVRNEEEGLFCYLWQRWYHAHCENVGDRLCEPLQEESGLPWR